MPSAAEIAAAWLTEAELAVYAGEYQPQRLPGRAQLVPLAHDRRVRGELQLFSGRTIDVPSIFIAGTSDWAVYQRPGAFERMQEACTRMTGCHLLDGAGHWVQQEQAGGHRPAAGFPAPAGNGLKPDLAIASAQIQNPSRISRLRRPNIYSVADYLLRASSSSRRSSAVGEAAKAIHPLPARVDFLQVFAGDDKKWQRRSGNGPLLIRQPQFATDARPPKKLFRPISTGCTPPTPRSMPSWSISARKRSKQPPTGRWRKAPTLGALQGVPITLKINIDVEGQANSNGVVALKDNIAPGDSPVTANLRKAGAIILGITNTPEFSMRGFTDNPLHGPTLNPWDNAITCGGSSGGAAASIASGIGAIAHGNDIGGSLRWPRLLQRPRHHQIDARPRARL